MDKIKDQANIVSQLLFANDTGDIYKKTLTRTWDILREVGILLWLVLCLTFVGGEWFYRTSVGLGRSTRAWYTELSQKDSSVEAQPITSTGQALFDTVKSKTSYLLAQARQQLGLPEPPPPDPVAATPAPKPVAPVAPPYAPVAPTMTEVATTDGAEDELA
ncbi:MAG: hypothetical protein ACOYM4_05785 [Nodosilinea sp.]|jgi:hypothetical protein